jgi:hypothetical protein
MKRCIFLLIGVFFLSFLANAQYRINKKKYDYHTYSYQAGDPYNPYAAQRASAIIPGLGQMRSGAGGRGAVFLAGFIGCNVVFDVGLFSIINSWIECEKPDSWAKLMAPCGGLGVLLTWIWSSVDAGQVAKVNNLAWRDKNKTSINLQISPFFNSSRYNNTEKVQTGLSLRLTF